jgi:shikimate kinase
MESDDRAVPADRPGTDNIFLVGLMGAGKTSVGRLLARRLGRAFFDCDQEIERATGVNVPVIFEIEGEDGFRLRENRMLAELTRHSGVVLATGGGAVLLEDNRALLSANGTVVYLRATPHDRPLLQTADPLAKLTQLHAERDPLYRQIADVVIDTGHQSVSNLVHRLEQKLAELGASTAGKHESQEERAPTCAP